MENFRVLLDLSDLEDRVHKYVWMLISTIDLKYVSDLKKAVINKLALNRNDIKMFINGGLLLEEEKIMILRENDTVQIQYEKLSDSVVHNSSYKEMLDNKLPLNTEEYNGHEIVKHSKKHKRKSKEVSLEIVNENIEKDLSIRKRKRDVATVDKSERCEDDIMIQVEKHMNGSDINVEDICNRKKKKQNKSFDSPSVKDVTIENEIINVDGIDTMPIAAESTSITLDESRESRKMEENSNGKRDVASVDKLERCEDEIMVQVEKPINGSDIVVESFIQGSNCKKRKRKRHRKRKIEKNLIGPFMSANMNTFEKLAKENPPIFSPCDNFAGIRKHIRFTSPTPENSKKKIETVDLETNIVSQAEISLNKTCVSPNTKPSSFPTRNMYIDHANQIANKVYSNISSASNNTCTSPNTEITPLTTSMTYVDHVPSPKLSCKPCIKPTSSVSPSPAFENVENSVANKPEISMCTRLKDLSQNSWIASPMLRETENKSSPKVLKSQECEPSKHVILSYEDYSPLNALPPIGTHVAFKLLELDENYTPEVSKYKEGVIKSINPKSEDLEIELIKAEIKPGRTGKFENLNEDEVPSDEVIKMVTAPWSSLIEPRLISYC